MGDSTSPVTGRLKAEDEEAAMEALDKLAAMKEGDSFTTNWVGVARTLKAMLARPAMPDPDHAHDSLLDAMGQAYVDADGDSFQRMRAVYLALYAELTKQQAAAAPPSSSGLPLHIVIDQTDTSTNAVLEKCVEALVRFGIVTVGGSIGARIMGRINPKKLKPVFHCAGYKIASPAPGTNVDADWHDVNQAVAALLNDGYDCVSVTREMVPE